METLSLLLCIQESKENFSEFQLQGPRGQEKSLQIPKSVQVSESPTDFERKLIHSSIVRKVLLAQSMLVSLSILPVIKG